MKKELPKIATIFLITVGVVIWGLNYIFIGSAPKSKAAIEETISYFFDPTSTAQASGDFVTSVKIKPSVDMTIRGYQFEITFDTGKVQFKSIQYITGAVSAGIGDDNSKILAINDSGKIKVVGEIQSATGQVISASQNSQNTEIVAVTFTANSAQSSSITTGATDAKFLQINADYTLTEVMSAGGQASFSVNSSDIELTPTNTPAPTITPGGPTLTPIPTPVRAALCQSAAVSKTTLSPGESLTITSTANTSDIKIFSYSFYNLGNLYPTPPADNPKPICFDQSEIEFQSGTCPANTFHYSKKIDVDTPTNSKTVTVSYADLDKIDKGWNNGKPTNIQVNAYFTNSTGEFSLLNQNCVVKFNMTQAGQDGNAKLNLKLKFQGILKKPTTDALNKLNVKIKLLNETTRQESDYKTAEFTADDSGIWSGSIGFDADVNAKYTLYVKGPYHLQKKICDAGATETAGGTYRCTKGNITLKNGDNNLDLSGIVLLSGDLPDQDGSITAYDTSLIYNNLGKENDKCDVNRDGKCDTQDYSLVIAALSVKNDEL